MKKLLKFTLSTSLSLAFIFYLDDIFYGIKAFLYPKKTILREIHKEMTKTPDSTVEQLSTKTDNTSWLDFLLWGNEGYKERFKSDGIWETLWKPYITAEPKPVKEVMDTQPISTHQAVLDTDEQIKNNAIKSANHVQDVLFDYFGNNMSWIDYLIIQGFKLLAICIFFLLIYGLFTYFFKNVKKDD